MRYIPLLIALASPAYAQGQQCMPRADMVAALADQYHEELRADGIAGQTAIMELYASEAKGTWTIIVTTPNGIACMMASGQAFSAHDAEIAGEDS